jgi:exonuclease SbcC
MFLQKLFSPKWKHKNPNIRKEALQALNPGKEETQKIFAEVVKIDSDISIRRMVVGRLRDMALLRDLQQTQDQLADSAGKRIRQLIAGTGAYAVDFELRKQTLEQTADQHALEYVAREAKEAELRQLAVDKIERQSLLGDMAVNDADQDVRLKALEKIHQISTLDRVYKNSRLKDKRVSALAKERLDALTAEQERPKVLKKQAKQCCLDLESLLQRCKKTGTWLNAKPRFDSLQAAWQDSKAQWQERFGDWDAALSTAFSEYTEQFQERYRLKQEEEAQKRALEEKAEPFKAQKRKVCEDLEAQLAQLKAQDTAASRPDAQQLHALQSRLEQNAELWASAQKALAQEAQANPSVATEHEDIENRYYRLNQELKDCQKELQASLDYHAQLQELAENVAALVGREDAIDPAQVSTLQKRQAKLVQPRRFPVDSALQAQVDDNFTILSRRLEEQEEQRQAHIKDFTEIVEELSSALRAGKTKHAVNLSNRGKKLLGLIPQRDRRGLQKKQLIKQFNESNKQLNELQSWRKWSNAPVKEQLCERMQQLAEQVAENQDNPDFDFQDAAQRVQEARAEWKKITAAEPGSSNELWESFDAACTQAYEPCQRHFDQQTEVRVQNLKNREAACESLEEYLEVLSHKPSDLIDWKALDKIVRVAQEEWRTLGTVERDQRQAINKRFRTVINALRQLHLDQKNSNKEEKELLIKRADAVVKQLQEEKTGLRESIDAIKQLQADWKEVGLAAGDGELWKRFRASCDQVFERREQETAAAREERQSIIDARAAICESIENLAKLQGDALKAAQKEFEDFKQQWAALPSLQKPGSQKPASHNVSKHGGKQEPLEKRFRDACRAFEAQNQQRAENERQQMLQIQHQQAQLCRQGEALLFQCLQQQMPLEQGVQEWAKLDEQWRQLTEFAHNVSKALRQRFDSIQDLLQQASESGVGSVTESIQQQQAGRLDEKQRLCLQMEVLADIESPPEAQQARMEYQVSQLAEKMKQSASSDINYEAMELQVKWQLSGIVDSPLQDALENRFDNAYQAIIARS